MHYVFRILTISSLMVFNILQACAASEPAPDSQTVLKNLVYVDEKAAPHPRQKLHLVVPSAETKPPLLLWIPGGAWAAGDIDRELPIGRLLANSKISVAVIDHRMSPAGDWIDPNAEGGTAVHPDHIEDVAKAFAWLKNNAQKYGYDGDRIFVGGFSSGAHLSALLALDPNYLAAHGLDLTDISGAIPVAGAYELHSYYDAIEQWRGEDVAIGHVLGVFGDKSTLANASPTSHVSNAVVPMLVIAEADTIEYTNELRNAAENAGKTKLIRFIDYPAQSHRSMFIGLGDKRQPDFQARKEIIDFIHAN